MYLRVLEKGAPLFVQGQEPDAHCVLMSGGVDLYALPDGPPGSQVRRGAARRGGGRGAWARRFGRDDVCGSLGAAVRSRRGRRLRRGRTIHTTTERAAAANPWDAGGSTIDRGRGGGVSGAWRERGFLSRRRTESPG